MLIFYRGDGEDLRANGGRNGDTEMAARALCEHFKRRQATACSDMATVMFVRTHPGSLSQIRWKGYTKLFVGTGKCEAFRVPDGPPFKILKIYPLAE